MTHSSVAFAPNPPIVHEIQLDSFVTAQLVCDVEQDAAVAKERKGWRRCQWNASIEAQVDEAVEVVQVLRAHNCKSDRVV